MMTLRQEAALADFMRKDGAARGVPHWLENPEVNPGLHQCAGRREGSQDLFFLPFSFWGT
jgi:hypothetical protein